MNAPQCAHAPHCDEPAHGTEQSSLCDRCYHPEDGTLPCTECMAIDPDFSLREAGCARARSSARPAFTTVQCTMQCNDCAGLHTEIFKNEVLVFAHCYRRWCAACTPRSSKTRFSLLFTAAKVRRAAHSKSVFIAVMMSANSKKGHYMAFAYCYYPKYFPCLLHYGKSKFMEIEPKSNYVSFPIATMEIFSPTGNSLKAF